MNTSRGLPRALYPEWNRRKSRGFISLSPVLIVGIVLGLGLLAGAGWWWQQNMTSSPTIDPPRKSEEACRGRDAEKPYITSITPASGPAGTKVEIKGCNLSGFEGDLDATFERSDGKIIPLYGGNWSRKIIDAAEPSWMTVTVDTYCPTGREVGRYSGLEMECKKVEATLGTYKVYVETPEGKSNTVTFTVK